MAKNKSIHIETGFYGDIKIDFLDDLMPTSLEEARKMGSSHDLFVAPEHGSVLNGELIETCPGTGRFLIALEGRGNCVACQQEFVVGDKDIVPRQKSER